MELMDTNNLKIRQEERNNLARRLHDTVANELLQMQFLLLRVEDRLDQESFYELTSQLEFVRNQVRTIAHEMSDHVSNTISMDFSETMKSLLVDCTYIFSNVTFDLYFYPKQFNYNFQYDEITQLLLVMKELLLNAVRHGGADEIEISVTEHEAFISLSLYDNGIGFDVQKQQNGLGLKNVRQRVNVLKGSVNIDSKYQHGTSVYIELPKRKL